MKGTGGEGRVVDHLTPAQRAWVEANLPDHPPTESQLETVAQVVRDSRERRMKKEKEAAKAEQAARAVAS